MHGECNVKFYIQSLGKTLNIRAAAVYGFCYQS